MASLLTVSKAGKSIPGKYTITLKEASLAAHISSIKTKTASTHEYGLLNGCAGEFSVGR